MPKAIDTVTLTVTAAAAGGSLMAAAAGDSLQVRSTPAGKKIRLLNLWADVQTAGFFQVASPRLHDAVRGMRFRTRIDDQAPYLPMPAVQEFYDTDVLTATLAAAAVAGDIESVSMLLFYEDLQGIDARLLDWDTVKKRAVEMFTVENTITTGAGGGYTGGEAINVESDLLKANFDYALLGYRVSTPACTICWRGADTGNLRVSGPCDEDGGYYTKDWFINLSNAYGIPLIPVFNSNNRAGILMDAVQDENAGAVSCASIFARLA